MWRIHYRRASVHVTGRRRGYVLVCELIKATSRLIAFCKRGCFLGNTILNDDEIFWSKTGYVVSVLIRDCHVKLNHINDNVEVRSLLRFYAGFNSLKQEE